MKQVSAAGSEFGNTMVTSPSTPGVGPILVLMEKFASLYLATSGPHPGGIFGCFITVASLKDGTFEEYDWKVRGVAHPEEYPWVAKGQREEWASPQYADALSFADTLLRIEELTAGLLVIAADSVRMVSHIRRQCEASEVPPPRIRFASSRLLMSQHGMTANEEKQFGHLYSLGRREAQVAFIFHLARTYETTDMEELLARVGVLPGSLESKGYKPCAKAPVRGSIVGHPNPLQGRHVVVAGSHSLLSRADMKTFVEASGGKWQKTPTPKTDIAFLLAAPDENLGTERKVRELAASVQAIQLFESADLTDLVIAAPVEVQRQIRALPAHVVLKARALNEPRDWRNKVLEYPDGWPDAADVCVMCGKSVHIDQLNVLTYRHLCSSQCNKALERALDRFIEIEGIDVPRLRPYRFDRDPRVLRHTPTDNYIDFEFDGTGAKCGDVVHRGAYTTRYFRLQDLPPGHPVATDFAAGRCYSGPDSWFLENIAEENLAVAFEDMTGRWVVLRTGAMGLISPDMYLLSNIFPVPERYSLNERVRDVDDHGDLYLWEAPVFKDEPYLREDGKFPYTEAHEKERRRRDRMNRAKNSARKRMQDSGSISEVALVDVEKVFERDAFTCQLCRHPLDAGFRHPHPFSPSLDHVIPLSRGGSHMESNVQAAHLICNIIKSDAEEPRADRLLAKLEEAHERVRGSFRVLETVA